MPRPAQPFFFQGFWYTDAGGQRTKLAEGKENRQAAEDALLDHLQRLRRDRNKSYAEITLKDLANQFLENVRVNRSTDTLEDYRRSLKRFVKQHGRKRARDLTFLDADQHKNALVREGKKPNTVNHFINALKTCFNWASKVAGLLPDHPFRRLEKLPEEGRHRGTSPRTNSGRCLRGLFRSPVSADPVGVASHRRHAPRRSAR